MINMESWMYFSVKVDGVDVDEGDVASALKEMRSGDGKVREEFLGSDGFLFVSIDDWPEFGPKIDSNFTYEFGVDFIVEFLEEFGGDLPDGAQIALSAANDMRDLGIVLVYETDGEGEWGLADEYVGMEGYQGADIVDDVHEEHGWSPPVEEHPDRL